MKGILCLFFGHISAKKLQGFDGYETHICARCLTVYAKKR